MIKKEFNKILDILIPKVKEELNNKLNCNCDGGYHSLYIKTDDKKIKIAKSLNSPNGYISIHYYFLSKKGVQQEGYCREVTCYKEEYIDKTIDEIVNEVKRILREDRQEMWEIFNKGAYTDEYEL